MPDSEGMLGNASERPAAILEEMSFRSAGYPEI
jgi:hypothetical protein